jgi:hypothetical protein
MLSATLGAGVARADGILEAINFNEEAFYTLLSTKTTDASGTTKTDVTTYGSRTNARINYNLLPKLNLNAGGFFEKNWATFSNGDEIDTEITRIRPYIWLTLGDSQFNTAVGYDRSDDTTDTDGVDTTLTRSTYNFNLNWRPPGLPWTQVRYTRTETKDDPQELIDATQDLYFVKSEYAWRGLETYYAGTYLTTRDDLQRADSTQLTHEGKLFYATRPFLDGRITFSTDHRVRWSELTTEGPANLLLGSTTALAIPAATGLSAIDDTPISDPLAANAALNDGDVVTSGGVNIGFTGLGQPRRNVGLDLGAVQTVTTLRVWVEGFGVTPLPADITNFFSWEIYTSADNLNWTLHATVAPAPFGPFDRRFEITFSAVSTRYIKAVTRPLPGGVVGATDSSAFTTIFVTEVQAFVDQTAPGTGAGRQRFTQLFRSHNVELRAILFRTPSLYYRFFGDYREFDQDIDPIYTISNGLFFTHRLSRIFSTSANASIEFGEERGESRSAVLYYASLGATPLPTLTDSLVVSGNTQWLGQTTTKTNSVVLYNAAQLYRGLDATLNLGVNFLSEETADGQELDRTEYYVNVGAGITPHPNLTTSAYYLGRIIETSGGTAIRADGSLFTGGQQITEHRFDVGVSFTPFRTLALTATTNIVAETDRDTQVTQNFGANWAPFPDGTLQFSFFYAENRLPDESESRIIQPTLRWYLTPRRRSYLEATYQKSTLDGNAFKSESDLFTARLNIFY